MSVRALLMVRTARKIGLMNVARVVLYRLGLRTGLHPVLRIRGGAALPPFFSGPSSTVSHDVPTSWETHGRLFGWQDIPIVGRTPNWFWSSITGKYHPGPRQHWSKLPDFDPAVGDIKAIWEWSRGDWILANAARGASGDVASLDRLNMWMADWCMANPPYLGPNWKCGQEASLRVIHAIAALLILGRLKQPLAGLRQFVEVHLRRIAPTTAYARAQDNNHGTSEATALLLGGWLLETAGNAVGRRYASKGQKLLEERVCKLVFPDGGFSQYSVNYHRLMLDTLSCAEVMRRAFSKPAFGHVFYERAEAATRWLYQMVDPVTGDAPNLGANDGAHILNMAGTPYRDFRPSVQLAAALFCKQRAYPAEAGADVLAHWLQVQTPERPLQPRTSRCFPDYGLTTLIEDRVQATLLFPRYRFRPSQSDALHLDLWVEGVPHLCDAGSFSYAVPAEEGALYSGVAGHNSVEFDGADQMPKLGRFLYGDWLWTEEVANPVREGETQHCASSYESRSGRRHSRKVRLENSRLVVEDEISGFKLSAVIRWRLPDGEWVLSGLEAKSGSRRLSVFATHPPHRAELVQAWESDHYLSRKKCYVLEVAFDRGVKLVSEYIWA